MSARPSSTAEVREEIARAREQIAASAVALKQEVALRADWREWVRRNPGPVLISAFAFGFLLGQRRRR